MIDLYTFTTPNGWKASIMLEELALPYQTHIIHIGKNEQFAPAFVAINPNSKIPAIVDGDVTVFESGAILIYLAEKTGRLLPTSGQARANALEWVMFQMSAVGPQMGQLNHFANVAPEKIPYAIKRFFDETVRICKVLDHRLGESEYLAGADYTIADVCTYPWIGLGIKRLEAAGTLPELPHLRRWIDQVAARPAVQRGLAVPKL